MSEIHLRIFSVNFLIFFRLVEKLLETGLDASAHLHDGTSPIHLAAVLEDPDGCTIVSRMLDYGADPNVQTTNGLTPLHIAAMWGRAQTLDVLLDFGADVSAKDDDDTSALDYAEGAEENSEACIDALIRYRGKTLRKYRNIENIAEACKTGDKIFSSSEKSSSSSGTTNNSQNSSKSPSLKSTTDSTDSNVVQNENCPPAKDLNDCIASEETDISFNLKPSKTRKRGKGVVLRSLPDDSLSLSDAVLPLNSTQLNSLNSTQLNSTSSANREEDQRRKRWQAPIIDPRLIISESGDSTPGKATSFLIISSVNLLEFICHLPHPLLMCL